MHQSHNDQDDRANIQASRKGSVLIITGPPGSGKTTVARILGKQISPSVHLHTDDFWKYISRGWIAPYLAEAHRQNQTVINVIASSSFEYAAGGYHVIVDGIVGPWFLEPFLLTSTKTLIDLHYIVLRPDLDTTLGRAKRRGSDSLTDEAPIRSLHEQFAKLGELEPHALDTTSLSALQTAEIVLQQYRDAASLLLVGC